MPEAAQLVLERFIPTTGSIPQLNASAAPKFEMQIAAEEKLTLRKAGRYGRAWPVTPTDTSSIAILPQPEKQVVPELGTTRISVKESGSSPAKL